MSQRENLVSRKATPSATIEIRDDQLSNSYWVSISDDICMLSAHDCPHFRDLRPLLNCLHEGLRSRQFVLYLAHCLAVECTSS